MASPQNERLRVGSVPYLVGRPLDHGLGDEPGIELSHDVPARLVEQLRAGTIDVALVSSIELFRRPGYRYLADPCVAGRGFVGSVQVFLKRPLEELRSVALDPASRTAAALLRVVLPESVEFREVAPGVDPRAQDTDGWLRIGDAALRETLDPEAPPAFNPSDAWCRDTGLPFVFAPWIVAPGVEIEPWTPAFARARDRGLEARERLATEAAEAWGLPVEAARSYLVEECLYAPGEAMHAALVAFRDRAAARGMCEPGYSPQPVAVQSAERPTTS